MRAALVCYCKFVLTSSVTGVCTGGRHRCVSVRIIHHCADQRSQGAGHLEAG